MSQSSGLAPAPERHATREIVTFVLLVATTAFGVLNIPAASWRASPADPCHLAAIGGVAAVVAFGALRLFGERAYPLERLVAALFLVSMPVIYISSCLLYTHDDSWLWIEGLSLPVYGGLAFAGHRGRPWLLIIGIAAHGIGWDLWHYDLTEYIPNWYVIGCLTLDVAVALYLATRIGWWQRARG